MPKCISDTLKIEKIFKTLLPKQLDIQYAVGWTSYLYGFFNYSTRPLFSLLGKKVARLKFPLCQPSLCGLLASPAGT